MAAATGRLQLEVANIIECPICSETLSSPKILPCIHTFCLRCLESYGKNGRPGDTLVCPLCRAEFAIPAVGLVGLPKNFFLEKLAEVSRISHVVSDKEILCSICSDDIRSGESFPVSAKLFCIECGQHLCDPCSRQHKRFKSTSAHSVVAHGSQLKPEELVKFQTSFCQVHKSEPTKLFCLDCQLSACMTCYVEEHSGHKCVDILKVDDDFRQRLQTDVIDNVNERILIARQDLKVAYMKEKDAFLNIIAKAKSKINRSGEYLKERVDSHVRELTEELESIQTVRLAEMKCRKLKANDELAIMSNFRKYLQELKQKGSVHDVINAVTDEQVRRRAREVQSSPASHFERSDPDRVDISYPEKKFDSSYFDQQCLNLLGKIVFEPKGNDNDLYHTLSTKISKLFYFYLGAISYCSL